MIDLLKCAFYRVFQVMFSLGARMLPWRKAEMIQGKGSVCRVPELLRREKLKNPLVVTGPTLYQSGLTGKLTEILDREGIPYAVFHQVEANPSIETVEAIARFYTEHGCDGFIAFGGGSPIDAAKAAGARLAMPNKTIAQLGGLLKVHKPIPPLIAVPTTAGTGSETTIAAVITDTQTHHKYAIGDLHLIPLYAVLDPELTVGLPPHVTGATGMDALTHAVEAYLCWTNNTRESRRAAEEAVIMIVQNLEQAYGNAQNIRARSNMLVASYLAGYAFTRAGVGNVHAIAHTLGGLYGTPHGLANAVLLPIVLEDYGKAIHHKLARLAELTGIMPQGSREEKAAAFIREICAMNRRMSIPEHLNFIREEDVPQMVRWALKEANPTYPVPVVYTPQRCRGVIEALRGIENARK